MGYILLVFSALDLDHSFGLFLASHRNTQYPLTLYTAVSVDTARYAVVVVTMAVCSRSSNTSAPACFWGSKLEMDVKKSSNFGLHCVCSNCYYSRNMGKCFSGFMRLSSGLTVLWVTDRQPQRLLN